MAFEHVTFGSPCQIAEQLLSDSVKFIRAIENAEQYMRCNGIRAYCVVTGFERTAWGIRSVAKCTVTGVRNVRSGELHHPFYHFSFMYAIITINGNIYSSHHLTEDLL